MAPDNTEGELTELDAKIISTIESEFKRPEEIAEITGLALPQVMKRLRELTADGLVVVRNAKYGTPTVATKAPSLQESKQGPKIRRFR
jgi:DNA-binding Lrp family transcriptional regulator